MYNFETDELQARQELDEVYENEHSNVHLNYLKQQEVDNKSIKDLFLTLKK